MRGSTVVIFILVAAAHGTWAAKKSQIIEESEIGDDIAKIAKTLCETTEGFELQISQSKTVDKLVKFFQLLPWEHLLQECGELYLESLEFMQIVVESGNKNVCSEEKIHLIELFHRRYISKVKKHQQEQEKHQWVAPWLIQLFFMHYASKVSTICEQSATIAIAQVADQLDAALDTIDKEDAVLTPISETLGVSDLSNGYDNVFLLWNIVDKIPAEESEKFAPYLHDDSSQVRLTVSLRETERVEDLKSTCARRLRPIFSQSLLPVMRLVDLGYYPEEEFLVKEARESPTSRRLFVMAQVCEIMRPINVVEDPSLRSDQLVALPKDDYRSLVDDGLSHQSDEDSTEPDPLEQITKEVQFPDTSLDSSAGLQLINKDNVASMTKKVMKNTAHRRDAIQLVFRTMIMSFKSKMQSRLGFFFMASPQGSLCPTLKVEELASVDEKELEGAIQGLERCDQKKPEVHHKTDNSGGGLGSAIWRGVKATFKYIGIAIALCVSAILFVMVALLLGGMYFFKKA